MGRLTLVRTYALLIFALTTCGLLHGQTAEQNVLLNGGFELPGLPGNQDMLLLTNGSTYVSGWTVVNDGVGQAPFYGNTDLNDAVLSGEYGLVLNAGSGVRTTFRTEVGAFYELGVWLRPDDCMSCQGPAALRVTISGTALNLQQLSGWSYQTVQFYTSNSVNTLELFNPSSSPDFKRYSIDDVSIRKVPGATLGVRLMPVISVEGTIGARYQIQSATNITAPFWTTLTNLTLSNSPTLYLDTNNFNAPPAHRVYRAIRLP